jgi:hypothetical protein
VRVGLLHRLTLFTAISAADELMHIDPFLIHAVTPSLRARCALALFLLLSTAGAHSAIRTWPGAPPCSDALSSCISGANSGDIIEIASNSIDESVSGSPVDKSLTLRAAPGFAPTFVFGRDFFLAPSGNSNWTLRITGLRFDGVRIGLNPSGIGSIELDHLDFLRLPGDPAIDFSVIGSAATASQMTVSIHDNRIAHDKPSGVGIKISTQGEQVSGRITVRDNLIESVGTTAAAGSSGIVVYPWATGTGTEFDFVGNRVQPRDWDASEASRISQGFNLLAFANNAGNAIRVINNSFVTSRGSNGGTGAFVINDGGSNQYRIVNNSVIGGNPVGVRVEISGASTGVFANNAVLGAGNIGIQFLANANTGFSNRNNAVFGAASNSFTPGPGTITSDPLLSFTEPPRPVAASPLVNAGHLSTFTAAGPGTLPSAKVIDSDGLRRQLGTTIDIGAYEYGATSILHDTTGFAPSSPLTHPVLDVNASAVMQITRSDGRQLDAMVVNPRPMTQTYSEITQRWSLLADDGFNLNTRAGFNLLANPPGADVGNMVVSPGLIFSVSGTSLTLPWALLPSDWILLVNATRGAGLSVTPNPHPSGAAYIDFQWRIINLDAAAMPVGTAFAIYAQPPSRNAYEHIVQPSNQPVPTVSLLDHPLLNGFPCAVAHVAASGNGFQAIPHFSVHYESGLQRWFIQAETAGSQLTGNSRFFVVVDPRSVEDACVGELFNDGFEDAS